MISFLTSLLYSYELIGRDIFISSVFAGLVSLVYSAMLWVCMICDKVKYGSFFAWI